MNLASTIGSEKKNTCSLTLFSHFSDETYTENGDTKKPLCLHIFSVWFARIFLFQQKSPCNQNPIQFVFITGGIMFYYRLSPIRLHRP